MSRPQLMNAVADGIVTGWVEAKRHDCGVCGHPTRVIGINGVALPMGIEKADRKILLNQACQDLPPGREAYIGIGCGCYAKGHRQIAHITSALKVRRADRDS